ncbi:AI-2E family transporter [Lutibaculum baratangense]|uniref:Putative permease often clustered with de novo purine synthesis n=1 Tax=Lutibaculum baratangense AMV1 TaxID=631454 RepID=V4RBJ0_9HYPH|nr:AI-2E family transporter [Lutibaculum baratangense]ESR23511.1 putative permease often clustered with de novo purine synthesis [Lutibaculum baratangense AMV1]
MRLERKVAFWLGALAVFVLLLYILKPILLPFIAGMALAYVLDPIADRIERLGANRLVATLTILLLFTLIVALVLVALVPTLAHQVAVFIERLPSLLERLEALWDEFVTHWLEVDWIGREWLGELLPPEAETATFSDTISNFAGQAASWAGSLVGTVVTGGFALVNAIALLVVTPVVAFYLLYDWDRMVASIDNWVPRDHVGTVRRLAREIDAALAGFVRGQGLVCLILGAIYATGLSIIGLNFALLIGVGAGLISFVPYVGTITGFVVGVAVALVQFWPSWGPIIAVIGVFVIGQFIEGNFLQPKLVGGSVGVHPVWLMFALFAFAYLFGFVGMLLAVPLSAALGVLTRFALSRYLDSSLYRGGAGGAADREP